MPLYEFECKKCGNVFEQLVFPSDDEDNLTCPSCGEGDIRRLISCFSYVSAGSGKGLSTGLSSACSSPPGGFT